MVLLIVYINMQTNHYRSSQTPLTYAVPLHRVKVGAWCVVNARIVEPVLFNELINSKIYCNRFAQRVAKQRLSKQTSTERPFLCGP
jgi:hypothetical protein